MTIEVGDLVKIKGADWLPHSVGVVTEVKELVHDQSGDGYTAITALVDDNYYTFSEKDFDLLNKASQDK